MPPTSYAVEVSRTPRLVLSLAFVVLVLEGYDLIMFGSVVPALLAYSEWGLTVENVGKVGSVAIIGMMIGALLAGVLTDWIGRRAVLLASVAGFSLAMIICGAAPNVEVFILGRLLVGIGAGCLLPTVIALVLEYSPMSKRNFNSSLAFAGTGTGGALSGLLALAFVPDGEFRPMFYIGAVPALVLLPFLARSVPESAAYLIARGRRDEAERVLVKHGIEASIVQSPDAATDIGASERHRFAALFSQGWAATTLLFWAITFLNLLLLFGANTWLPSLMTASGFGIRSALTFLLVLNVGAVFGGMAASKLADQYGSRVVASTSFVLGALAFALLATQPPLVVTYLLVALAGLGVTGTQLLVNSFVGSSYPASRRATGLGFSLGVGRLGGILGPTLGGYVLAAQLPQAWNFLVFAVPALLAAVLVIVVSPPSGRKLGNGRSHAAVDAGEGEGGALSLAD